MKKVNFILAFALLMGAIMIQASCKKSNDPNPTLPPDNSLGVTVGGSALVFSSVTPSIQQATVNLVLKNYVRIIGAIGVNGDYFVINIFYQEINANAQIDLAKSTSWDMGNLQGNKYLNANNKITVSGASGILTLTKNDLVNKRIEGSFTGVMLDNQGVKISVTGGSFAVSY